jgi:hypothetical protein
MSSVCTARSEFSTLICSKIEDDDEYLRNLVSPDGATFRSNRVVHRSSRNCRICGSSASNKCVEHKRGISMLIFWVVTPCEFVVDTLIF